MNKYMILGGAALVAVAGVAVAQNAVQPRIDRNADVTRQQVVERADQRFARLDVNNDGRATPEEARQAHEQRRGERAGRMFERLDANSDGSISRAEFDQARAQRSERRTERGERRGMRHGRGGMRQGRGERLFGEQGFVTRDQMRERALARFDRMDANSDGTLTAAERREARQQRMQERRGQTS
jgi:Ca2+-binding EF-hand superfamily protein